jgi:alginate O-acetyltransferase complex protein AlgI
VTFSSLVFCFFFLPVALASYWLVPRRLRNITLLASSLLFYVWGAGWVVLVLVATTLIDWALALVADRARADGRDALARAACAASVIANLGLLAWFKYVDFLVGESNGLLSHLGLPTIALAHVVLPIGVSFFTFHRISYAVDVRRGRPALRNPIDLLLYISLFPHLIAGPIVRYGDIADQLPPANRSVTLASFSEGVVRFLHGLVKKVIVADAVAHIADRIFALPTGRLTFTLAWLGALAYTVQIYFDFSAYSDMAIGLAAMFGFRFPENFDRPYSALSITDFWRRWHMTLSRWFRDYLYIPLGGSRGTPWRTYVNLAVVWTLTGFWHGANITFLAWGAYNGALIILERVTGQRPVGDEECSYRMARRVVTMLLIIFGWVLFRADGVHHAAGYLGAMVPLHLGSITDLDIARRHDLLLLALGIASFALPARFSGWRLVTRAEGLAAGAARGVLFVVLVPYSVLVMASGSFSPFLYFRF